MANFLGIKQSLLPEYLAAKAKGEHLGYLWLITNVDGEGNKIDGSYDIYFGSRKYSENGVVYHNLINTLGELMDENGAFILPINKDFTSFDETNVNSISDILYAIDAVIKKNADDLANVYTKTEVDRFITDIEALLNKCATGVTVTVSGSTYTGTLANNVVNVDLTDAFDAAGKIKGVTVDGTEVVADANGIVDIVLSGKAEASNVYTKDQADAKFLTGVTIPEYEIVKQDTADAGYAATYYLAKDGVQVGTKINTTLDQVLKSSAIYTVTEADKPYSGAVVGDKYVKFEFQNNDTPQYLPVKDLVDVYTGSTSIEVSENNVISVKEVDASLTKLSTTIEVKGGPLADDASDNWPWTDGDKKVIPSGKTMEEILTALFLKVVDGTVVFGNVSWNPAVNKPTVTLSKTGTIEVGTKVKVTKLTNGDFNKAKRSVTLTTTQGYFSGDTYNSATTKTFYSAESTSSGTEVITCKWNNVATDVTVNSTELTVIEGTNTIVATQSGLTATVSAIPAMTVYASTNTKTKLTDTTPSKKQVATLDEAEDTYTVTGLSNSNSTSVTAYYPIYTNGVASSANVPSSETSLVANDGTKLPLVADNTAFYVKFGPMIDGGTGYRLLLKSGKKITHALAVNIFNSNKHEIDMKNDFVKATDPVKMKSGGVEIDYDVYEAKGSSGANAFEFKID